YETQKSPPGSQPHLGLPGFIFGCTVLATLWFDTWRVSLRDVGPYGLRALAFITDVLIAIIATGVFCITIAALRMGHSALPIRTAIWRAAAGGCALFVGTRTVVAASQWYDPHDRYIEVASGLVWLLVLVTPILTGWTLRGKSQ